MPRSRPFAQVDVFSSRPFGGNPVAVVLDAADLSDDDMQRIARWTNLSETTFVLEPRDPDADYRLRIFTPSGELPFAGHPTLGSAAAWLDGGGRPARASLVSQECGAGLVPVRIEPGGFAFRAPDRVRTGELEPDALDAIVRVLGIRADEVLSHQWVDNGPGWAVVELADARRVLELDPDVSLLPDGMFGAFGWYPEGSPHAYELRSFAPRVGVAEDPVCGSMNASVAQWLGSAGRVPPRYAVSQGAQLGREGEIALSRDDDGTTWVGGACTVAVRGTIEA